MMENIDEALIPKLKGKIIGDMVYIDLRVLNEKAIFNENVGSFYPSKLIVYGYNKKTVIGQKIVEMLDDEEFYKLAPYLLLTIIDKLDDRPMSAMCFNKKLTRRIKKVFKLAGIDAFFANRLEEFDNITA